MVVRNGKPPIKHFARSISEYNAEIIVNAGIVDTESALLGENPRPRELNLTPLETNRGIKIEVAGNAVRREPDYQQ
jgi:hypothetical protein